MIEPSYMTSLDNFYNGGTVVMEVIDKSLKN